MPPSSSESLNGGPQINGNDDLMSVCNAVAAKVNVFLEIESASPLLNAVQEQTRVALGVISAALEKYRSLPLHLQDPPGHS